MLYAALCCLTHGALKNLYTSKNLMHVLLKVVLRVLRVIDRSLKNHLISMLFIDHLLFDRSFTH